MSARPLHVACVQTDLCADMVTAIEVVCNGAGAEVDCPPRNMLGIFGLLSPGGYRLRVAATSKEWDVNHIDWAKDGLTAACNSVGESEVMKSAQHADVR